MKGFTHFISATALASCIPGVTEYAMQDMSCILVLAGIFGILPDTLDFKLNRFLHRYDTIYEPEQAPDPNEIAATIAHHMGRAFTERRTVNLHLHTIRLGADLWRLYRIWFVQATQEVVVEIGPVVNTGKVPIPGTEPITDRVGRAKVPCPFSQDYDMLTTVSIFSGPSFGFEPEGDGIAVQFIPWHRSWSHSLVLGLLCGLASWTVAALALRSWSGPAWMYGAVVLVGFWIHVIEDQFSFLGCNLFFPFTRRRVHGTRSMHSGDPLPNFIACWLSVALLFWNLYRTNSAAIAALHINGFHYLMCVVVLPTAVLLTGSLLLRKPKAVQPQPPEEDENEETDV